MKKRVCRDYSGDDVPFSNSRARKWGLFSTTLVLNALLGFSVVYAAPTSNDLRHVSAAAAQPILPEPPVPDVRNPGPATRAKLNCQGASSATSASGQVAAPGTSHLLIELADNIAWQPRDGRIRFIIKTTDNTAPSAINGIETAVCFGWPKKVFESADTDITEKYYAGAYLRTVARTENSITYETSLSDGLWDPDQKNPPPTVGDVLFKDTINKWRGQSKHVYDGLGLVPIVHMRVVSRTQGNADVMNDVNELDTVIPVGIPFRAMALGLMLAAIGIAWAALTYWGKDRNIKGGAILRVIANKDGYASLTQFQILLWTLVIGAGITYVMAITGSLIDVPLQELALLGIAGFSALSAAYASKRDQAAQQVAPQSQQGQPAVPQVQAPQVAAPQPAAPNNAAATQREPKWSDLVVWNETIDITRVQMLVFTVLAAAFVAIKICDESTIPAIPDGIILLMGLTNGVYVGGRFVST